VPTGQDVQVIVPVVLVYVPAAQFVHDEAPAAEYVPMGQDVQDVDPVLPV
jgi:hypothetical protein